MLFRSAFGGAGHLKTHVRTVHEKRRDHACPHCAATFTQSSNRTTHVRAVHEKRRDHACTHCAAVFSEASKRTRHMRTQHPDNNKACKEEPERFV